MRKIIYILLILIPTFFESCSIQKEVEIYNPKKIEQTKFEHKKLTVSDGFFSKNRKMNTRHHYFVKVDRGFVFRPRYQQEFIRHIKTKPLKGNDKVRVFRKKQKFAI